MATVKCHSLSVNCNPTFGPPWILHIVYMPRNNGKSRSVDEGLQNTHINNGKS